MSKAVEPEPLTEREVQTLRDLARAYDGAGTVGRIALRVLVIIGALASALAALLGLWHMIFYAGVGPSPPFSSHR